MLTDKVDLVNANIFNAKTSNKANNVIKQNVQKWYYAIWVMSVIINMVVLVYIGIRMAISTVADEKAKYKKQLIAWFQSIVLLFAMHFIIRLIFFCWKNISRHVDSNFKWYYRKCIKWRRHKKT